MKKNGITPDSDSNDQVTVQNGGYLREPRPRESFHEDYVDTEYRTVESEKDFRDYIAIMLRRKKTIFTVAAIVFVLAAIYTFTRPKIYLSEATLEIEKESGTSLTNIGDVLGGGGTGTEGSENYNTQLRLIKNRATARELITRMNVAAAPEFAPKPSLVGSAVGGVKQMFSSLTGGGTPDLPNPSSAEEGLVDAVMSRISANRDKESRLLIVGMEARSPKFAQEMLNNLVEIYLDQNLNKRRRSQREASMWIQEELHTAQDRVLKSLAALVDFTSKHGVVGVDESANHVLAFFQKTADALVASKLQRLQLEAIQKQSGMSEAAAMSGVKAPDMEQLAGRLSVLESEYAQMSEIYSDGYPKLILIKKQINFIRERIDKEQTRAVSAVVAVAKKQEGLSLEAFDEARKSAIDSKSVGVGFAVLKKEAETNEEIFRILLTKSKELQISTEVIGNNIITVVPPSIPLRPIKPKKMLNLMLGIILGLGLGLAAAFIQETLDASVQDARDLEKLRLTNLGMIPNYGMVQKIEARDNNRVRESKQSQNDQSVKLPAELVASTDPSSILSEAFSIVRTSLFLTTSCNVCKSVLVTSAAPGEGKSFIATSLGSVLANYGQRVLLLEADLRKPRVSPVFGEKFNRPGFSTLLTFKNIGWRKCVYETAIPNLSVMSSGPLPKDPARLLDSDRMQELIQELSDAFDLVLIDTSPVNGLPDARILASFVDGVIFVVRQGHASIDVIKSARATLSKVGNTNILGAIFNNVGVSDSRYSKYLYGQYAAFSGYAGYNHYSSYKYEAY